MAFRFGKAAASVAPAPIDSPVELPESKATEQLIETHARINEANMAVQDMVLDQKIAPESEAVKDRVKLSKLVADDFPFDESQLEAIDGLANQQYGCLTGAAGTGKTTSTKALVDRLQDQLGLVDMSAYFKMGKVGTVEYDDAMDKRQALEDGDFEESEHHIPSICLCGFTGRSTQMIKKNFPRDWHKNIMTIHRMLAFMPEFYEDYDSDMGMMRNKMRFVPQYTRFTKLPWDIIIIDEAGMVSIELWNQVWEAAKEGCRVFMIGDINQLPPVHGRSIFGFAMTKWPSWELTHIHRQQGVNNSIVDNAWAILKGQRPKSDEYQSDPGWKFAMMPVPEDSVLASQKIRKWLATMAGKAYVPNRDSVITAINGEEISARGSALGQIPMNRELAIVFNKDSPRYIIDAGRERKQFAVGDKVMATRNDYETGVTNGMTGLITKIERNGAYVGDYRRFGTVAEVSEYLSEVEEVVDDDDFSLEELADTHEEVSEGLKNAKEAKERGPASHMVTVTFGEGETAFDIVFATLAEVASLMTAYVVTCHKMQGGESPLVVIICHQSHKAMLNREWLYTAVTRASGKCVLFYTDLGLRAALNKQRITGKTLAEKVKVFVELGTKGIAGAAVDISSLPEAHSLNTGLVVAKPQTILEQQPAKLERDESKPNPLAEQLARARARRNGASEPTQTVHHRVDVHVHHHVTPPPPPKPVNPVIDKGTLYQQDVERQMARFDQMMAKPAPVPLVAQARKFVVPSGPVRVISQAARPAPLLLAYQPVPTSESVPQVKKAPFRFGRK